jgi:hypothetical protein
MQFSVTGDDSVAHVIIAERSIVARNSPTNNSLHRNFEVSWRAVISYMGQIAAGVRFMTII